MGSRYYNPARLFFVAKPAGDALQQAG